MKPAVKGEPQVHLTLGSRYHVRSLASREAVLETRGTFRGVVSLGSIDAIALEIDDAANAAMHGKNRVIPTHMVLSIDILEAVKAEEDSPDEAHMHYT